jgi:peptide/nickel transport system ATP-binding protein
MPTLLELRGVTKRYEQHRFFGRRAAPPALADIHLRFAADAPRILAVVGESGSGKTTLAQILLGFVQPTEGTVLYEGTPLERLNRTMRSRMRRDVQAVLQDPFSAFNPFYMVDHALIVPLRKFGLAESRADRYAKMRAACEQVGLNPDDTLGRYPHQLSGGQRQRLMVARALMLAPRLIVADEPVSMVDASLRATILESLAALRKLHGISVVYITHDLTTAYHVADDVLVLYRGCVVESGRTTEVLADPQHPYTQLLIDSIAWPDLKRRWGKKPLAMPGEDVAEGPGCAFRARCPEAVAACAARHPEPTVLSPTHRVACHVRAASLAQAAGERLSE